MDELRRYVDRLFDGRRETGAIRELKEEILGNLEARAADYLAEGRSPKEALTLAMQALGSIEGLLPDQKTIYLNRFRIELLQFALLYTVLAWTLTIPLRLIPSGIVANTFLLLLAVGLGIFYLIFSRKNEEFLDTAAPLDQRKLSRHGRTAWLIWALFILLTAVLTTVKYFGSDIWFGRPLHLEGPYRLAQIAVSYILPFITMALPLLYRKARTLTEKYEVDDR